MMNKFGRELRDFLEFQNISNKEFANRIDTTPKNLIDILDGKIELSQNMIYNISFVTDIPVNYIENVEANFKMDKNIDKYLEEENITIKEYINRFSYKVFSKQYNYKFTNERNDYSIARDILKYLRITNPKTLYKQDNSIFYKSKNDNIELLSLWLEKCDRSISEQKVNIYDKNKLHFIIEFIKDEALNNSFNSVELIKTFNKYGIYLAIENDLPGSKIRGAFKVKGNKPCIFITRKHKRIADIYFALLHELAHCKSDFNRAKKGSLISLLEENNKEDDYEEKADLQAFNWMIDEKEYIKIKNNYYIEYKNIPKSFIAYRLAYDKIISYSSKYYQKYNILLEQETINK